VPAALRRWTRIVLGYRWVVVVIGVAAAVLFAVYTATNLGVSTDTENMIDDDLEWRQDFIRFRESFPERYRTILVVVTSDSALMVERAVRRLDARLDEHPGHFTDSYAPTADPPLADRELLYLDVEQLETLTDQLAAAQPLLGFLRQNYTLSGLFELLGRVSRQSDSSPAMDVIGRMGDAISGTLAGKNGRMAWGVRPYGDRAGPARRLIVVKPVFDSSHARPAGHAIDELRRLGEETEREFEGRVTVELTGTVAMEDDEFVSVSRNARMTGVLAFVSVVAILMLALRSVRMLLAGIFTLTAGLASTAAFAAFAVGTLNVISVAFAVLYIGLAIDFVIHYLLRVRELGAHGSDVSGALVTASGDVGGSLVICAVTTAMGFYSFIPTTFTGVSQLGLISGTGMFISLLVTLTLLPALIRVLFTTRSLADVTAAAWLPGSQLSGLLRYRKTVIAVPMLTALLGVTVIPELRFEADPLLLRDPNTESVRVFRELSAEPMISPRAISVIASPGEATSQLTSRLDELPTVERVVSLADFRLENADEKLALLEDLELMLGPSFADYPALTGVDLAQVRSSLEDLRDDLRTMDTDRYPELQRLGDSLRQLDARLDSVTPEEQRALLNRLQDNLLGGLAEDMRLLAARIISPSATVEPLPQSFVSRWRTPDGRNLIEVIPAIDITNPEYARKFVSEVREVAPRATGLPVVFDRAGATVVTAFGQAFLYAGVAISLLMVYFLRSVVDTTLVLVPLSLAAAITAGIMFVIDLPFNFANIIALPLLMGIGVDNGIHLIHRSRIQPANSNLLTTSTARAIFFSSVTTLASFGNLSLSSHPGMSSMGALLGIGLAIILVTMLLVLPAMLTWRET